MEVFPVWHVQHARSQDGRPIEHVDPDRDIPFDEENGDSLKLLGIFSSGVKARQRIERARSVPGFNEEPECFIVDVYVLDQDEWIEGFAEYDGDPTH